VGELVHQRPVALEDEDGFVYDRARVYAAPLPGGTWEAWIEFVAADRSRTLRSGRETTQRHLDGVAYWATGLEPVYFEGAFARAERASAVGAEDGGGPSTAAVPRQARVEVETLDPELPLRVMAASTLLPGQRRRIQEAGVVVYAGQLRPPSRETPGRYAFLVEFGTANGAAVLANTLWTHLRGAARVLVDGIEVAADHATLKAALLDASA
jgi:hypothetical protein